MQGPLDENRRHYERQAIAARYAKQSGLRPAEVAVLQRYRDRIAGARILDLGVGGGRTTPALVQLGSDYVGVDYSAQMIGRCRARFPSVKFELADARDLSRLADSNFDFVLFSNNGIDAVGHDDRIEILRQVHRKLSAGGLFIFSSHNRKALVPKPWDIRQFDVGPLRAPLRFAKRLMASPLATINYLRRAPANEVHRDYSVEVDSGNLYSLVHYRITGEAQRRQLQQTGFGDIEAFSIDGRLLTASELRANENSWIHYACRRETEEQPAG